MYIKYSKKDGDRKIVSTRFVTGKILCPISTVTVKWNAFHIWSSRDMYLQVQQNLHTQFAVQLHSCVPMTQRKRRKASTSLYVLTQQYLPCANEGCKDQVSRICTPESLTCPMSKCMILLQCLLILARHRWKKNSKLHPQEEAGSNSLFPHSKGKKGRNISET